LKRGHGIKVTKVTRETGGTTGKQVTNGDRSLESAVLKKKRGL
jgi:hypothetical protein